MADTPKKSKLVPIGLLLFLQGFIFPGLIRVYFEQVRSGQAQLSAMERILVGSRDLSVLGMFLGLACLIIGLLRNRRAKKSAAAA